MQRKDFSKVFNQVSLLDASVVEELERVFYDPNEGFVWDVGFQKRGLFQWFSREIVDYDFGLAVGEVAGIETSLGSRMIVVGTRAGNVVLHEKIQEEKVHRPLDDEEVRDIIVMSHYPSTLKNLLGTRPVRIDQLYLYTGFFNDADNIGYTLERLLEDINAA